MKNFCKFCNDGQTYKPYFGYFDQDNVWSSVSNMLKRFKLQDVPVTLSYESVYI